MGLAKRVIPCLDVTAGRVVKGVNFVELRDAGDPVEIAARYDREGADELCFLDITASSDEREIILQVIESVDSHSNAPRLCTALARIPVWSNRAQNRNPARIALSGTTCGIDWSL